MIVQDSWDRAATTTTEWNRLEWNIECSYFDYFLISARLQKFIASGSILSPWRGEKEHLNIARIESWSSFNESGFLSIAPQPLNNFDVKEL